MNDKYYSPGNINRLVVITEEFTARYERNSGKYIRHILAFNGRGMDQAGSLRANTAEAQVQS